MIRGALALALLAVAGCASGAPQREADTYADYLIGRVANLRDDHNAAADRYFEALMRSPRDQALIEGAITASLSVGDGERARRAVRMAPREQAPPLAHVVRAADALRAGNWRRADEEIGRVEGAASEELIARMMQVWARVGDGRVDDVLMQLEPLSSIRPYGGLFAYQQAMALDFAGRTEEALPVYAEGASGMFLPQGLTQYADALARTGRRDEAIAVLRSSAAMRANPALTDALARIEAGVPLNTALTPARGAGIGLFGLATIFLQEHDPQSALVTLSVALMLDPSNDAARLLMAETQAGNGGAELARATLRGIDPASPYAANARVMQAWSLLDEGRADEAFLLAQTYADAGDARMRRALADMYASVDRYAEAEPLYSSLIAADGASWRLYLARASARDRLGDWPGAEADLSRALELAPDQPEVLNYLGYSWVDRGERLQEGMALIRRAVALRPDSAAIIDSLGWAYYRLGDYEQALSNLERAVEINPTDATLNDHLGDVYWRLGRRIEARFQWRRALTQEPEDAAAIQAKLDQGLAPIPPTRAASR